MKNFKLIRFLMSLALGLLLVQCTSEPIPGPPGANGQDGQDGVSTGPGTSTTVLLAKKVFLGPEIDGVIDASWENVQSLTGTTEVPDPGNDVFRGYVGDKQDVVLKAQYDDDYIYFLAQWKDAEQDASRDTWYFDSTTSRWKQESNKPVFDASGTKIRDAFYEDKFAMQWQIGNNVTDWAANTCFATCHTGLSEADGFAKHYTVAAGQQTDMWHWKSVRTGLPTGQFDDKHVTDTPITDARHGDAKISGGHKNNKQTLLLDGTGAEVSVPKYFIPGRTDYYWILEDEVDNGTAKLITAVHSDGKLDYDGGTIDPVADTDFQRPVTTDIHSPALKGMPSITTTAFVGSRGDILCGQSYTGNGWILEWKRKLDTGHDDDVVFDPTKEYPFGYATFDNAAIAHGIKPFMTLKFEQ